jgi:murein DD-endopeptidase MepM/ murein hydrolase activator NlpD
MNISFFMKLNLLLLLIFYGAFYSQWACYPLGNGGSMVCGWGCYSGHQGQDWQYMPNNTSYGQNIYAVESGVVVHMVTGHTLCDDPFIPGGLDWAQPSNLIILYHPSVNLYTRYVHIANVVPGLTIGSQVNKGQVIAYIGNVGPISPCDNSNPQINAHLHFEVGTGYSGNGLTGKFNPAGIFSGCYPPFCCGPTSWVNTSCSGIFQDTGGPNATYSNNENYTVTIAPPNASQISMTFYWLDLEQGYDFLYLYDGASTNAPLIGVYTGNQNPGTVMASSGSLTIRFFSDGSVVKQGWSADWICSYPAPQNLNYSYVGCPKISLNLSWTHQGNNWYADVSDDSTFTNFWNRNVSNTTQVVCPDYFYNIFNQTHPLTLQPLKKYFWRMWNGYNHTPVYSFTVPLCFYTYTNCAGTFYDTGGSAGNYSNNEDYHLIIQPTGAVQVQLSFNSFQLHPSDTLWAYNGNVSPSTLLGKYTGNQVPPLITANSGTLIVRFKSDFLNSGNGWSANWNCILNSTSLNEINYTSNLPQPFIKNGYLFLPSCDEHNELYISDITGKKIISLTNQPKFNNSALPIFHLPKGIYFVYYSCQDYVFVKKFFQE